MVRPILIALALFQTATLSPIRIGPTAGHLTDTDVAEMRTVLGRNDIWIVIGHSGMLADRWGMSAYLTPTHVTPDLRRGRMTLLVASLPESLAYAKHGPWRQASEFPSLDYAQVPAAGRDPGQVADSRDLNLPFSVVGEFTDSEIVTLVRFIRSSPAAHETSPRGVAKPVPDIYLTVRGQWPIGALTRERDGTVTVRLLGTDQDERSGQVATVRRSGANWVVVRVSAVFA